MMGKKKHVLPKICGNQVVFTVPTEKQNKGRTSVAAFFQIGEEIS